MDNIVYYNDLYDLYGSLLTDKQCQYFEDYYFHNLSFSEIADVYHISRNAAFKQVHTVVLKLDEYEKKLKLLQKKEKINNIAASISDSILSDELKNIF